MYSYNLYVIMLKNMFLYETNVTIIIELNYAREPKLLKL